MMKKISRLAQRSLIKAKSFTLIEILFVVALVALIMAAVYPYIRSSHIGWQSVDRRSEVIQNARIGMNKMITALRESTGFVSVTSMISANGQIVFLDKTGAQLEFKKYDDGTHDMLGYVVGATTYPLAGPITSLKFTCYEENGTTTTTTVNNIKSVEIELICSDQEGVVDDQVVTSRVFYRNS